jgi:hypothetical protein
MQLNRARLAHQKGTKKKQKKKKNKNELLLSNYKGKTKNVSLTRNCILFLCLCDFTLEIIFLNEGRIKQYGITIYISNRNIIFHHVAYVLTLPFSVCRRFVVTRFCKINIFGHADKYD